jgi:hypothetical protein
VDHAEAKAADGELDGRLEQIVELAVVVVAGDGEDGRDLGQLGEDRGGVDVTGVEDEADAEPAEKVEDLGREAAGAVAVDVGVGEDADGEGS